MADSQLKSFRGATFQEWRFEPGHAEALHPIDSLEAMGIPEDRLIHRGVEVYARLTALEGVKIRLQFPHLDWSFDETEA